MKHLIADASVDLSGIGMDVAEFAVRSGLCKSKSAARREIEQGALRLDGIVIRDKFARVALDGSCFVLVEKV